MTKPVVAILAPLQNKYSETFVYAHRKYLDGEIKFFYGGWLPDQLEGLGSISEFRGFLGEIGRVLHKTNRYIRKDNGKSQPDWRVLDLRNAFKKCKINVAFAEYGPTAVHCLSVCQELQIPLIVHFHGFDATEKKTLAEYGQGYRDVFAYARYIVVVSKKMMHELSNMGAPSEKLVYNPYGPEDDFFTIDSNRKEKKFLSIGRFVDKKAPHLTLLAFKRLLVKHPEASLYFGGDGPLLSVCQDLAKVWDLDSKVFFLGPLSPDGVRLHMGDSLAYVQHSVTAANGDSEGAPIAIMEAGAAGLPVVSTMHAGIPDIVIDGETGLLTEERDVTAMSQCMEKLADDFDLASRMGEAGRARVRENFSISRYIGILNQLIEEANN